MVTDAQIIRTVKATAGNRAEAARRLGVAASTVRQRLLKLGLDLAPPPCRGGRPTKGRWMHLEGECIQKVAVTLLVAGLHELFDVEKMSPETILRRVVALVGVMAGDREKQWRWTPERLAARQEELVWCFLTEWRNECPP